MSSYYANRQSGQVFLVDEEDDKLTVSDHQGEQRHGIVKAVFQQEHVELKPQPAYLSIEAKAASAAADEAGEHPE